MRSSSRFVCALFWTAVTILPSMALAQQQVPFVPREFYNGGRRLSETEISFCVWEDNPTIQFDKAVAERIADVLVLEPKFYEVPSVKQLSNAAFWQSVFVALADHCDAFMGFSLTQVQLPDWLIASRPYYRAPFVFAVTNTQYKRFADIAAGTAVGSQLFTPADYQLLSYLRSLPEQKRWKRFPYDSAHRLVDSLLDGTVAGALISAPLLYAETDGNPEENGVYVLPTDPLKIPPSEIGVVFRSRNVFLRNLLDEGISALISSQGVEQLLSDYKLPGSPGAAGR